ncbi:MAG: two pore domain potassium channel family protein [Ardenticatenaceae bacterium]|nr:two pore domain potassium channel family protein [Ardenticatenaceae bacterium]
MLTLEQQAALDRLFAQVEGKGETAVSPPPPDFLQTWFGLSAEQLDQKWQTFINQKNVWENRFLDWIEANPIESAYGFLGSAAVAFYYAEKESNPQVNTYVDAFHYIATCASVGYADIFPVTQTGRAIAAMVMVVGPSVADRSLNRPVAPGNSPK